MAQRRLGGQGRPRTADNRGGTYVAIDPEEAAIHPGRSSNLRRREQEHKRHGYVTVASYPGNQHQQERKLHRFYKNQQNDGEEFTVDNR